jgi:hypothetical protein
MTTARQQVAATAAARIDAEVEMGYDTPSTNDVLIEVAAESGFPVPASERSWQSLVSATNRLRQTN